jgi:hypothetical protein
MSIRIRVLVFASLLTGLSSSAGAQTEPIFTPVPPGPDGVSFFFPNVIPPDPDYKIFSFTGVAESHGFPEPTTLGLNFDWTLPGGGTGVSPVVTFPMAPFMGNPVVASYLLDFCPTEVSIHFTTDSPAGASVSGAFLHECVPVPEPSTTGLAGLALACLIAWRARRRGR